MSMGHTVELASFYGSNVKVVGVILNFVGKEK